MRKMQHIKIIHEGIKNHECSECGKSFGWLSNLNNHMEQVHGNDQNYHAGTYMFSN